MNFVCSTIDLGDSYFGLTPHKTNNGRYLYLDKGWSKIKNYYYKGLSSSWCKIYVNPSIRIETNKLRDFPIYYRKNLVTNVQKLEGIVPADGIIEIDKDIKISYIEDFYPHITKEQKAFEECHEILFNALVENIGTFSANNKKKVLMPKQGGIDTLTVRSVFDYLEVAYEIFDLPTEKPTLSLLGTELSKSRWGFQQIQPQENCVVVTGFYGDEWILRNPYYAHVILSKRGVNIKDQFDKIEECYMKHYFEHYRKKCSRPSDISIETLITQIYNDFQIWHLDETYFLSPLKHLSLLTLLNADTQTVLDQVTDAKLSKSIIEKCNPRLLDLIDPLKNQHDPDWFPTNT
jgi:hypothetical protein